MEGKYTQRGFDLNFQLNAKETYLNCRKTLDFNIQKQIH